MICTENGHSLKMLKWGEMIFLRSSPIKNTHYGFLKITAARGMIAFPSQCGTIRLFEAKTLKAHISNRTQIVF